MIKLYVLYFKEFKKYYKNIVKNIILYIMLALLVILVGIINPYIYKILIDDIYSNRNFGLFKFFLFMTVAIFIIQVFLDYVTMRNNLTLYNKLKIKVKTILFKNILLRRLHKINESDTGYFSRLINEDFSIVGTFIVNNILNNIISLLNIIVYLGILFYINVYITLILILFLPIAIFLTKFIAKKIDKIRYILRNINAETDSWLYSTLSKWKIIKMFSSEDFQTDKYSEYLNKYVKISNKEMAFNSLNRILQNFKNEFIFSTGLYFIGAFFALNNSLKVGTIILIISYYQNIFNRLNSIIENTASLISNENTFHRLVPYIKETQNTKDSVIGRIENISLKNVYYTYNNDTDDRYILQNINLSINYGEKLCIVGKNGHGKTTLIKCLLDICKPQKGEVCYNNIDISTISMDSLYKKIGVVMQDAALFNLDFVDNLLYINPTLTIESIEDIYKKVYLYDKIEKSENKYNTSIGENGVQLSGGEMKRMLIAKAMVKKPDVLFFDEATSFLDAATEDKINDIIANNFMNQIVITISHRLSTIQNYKRIIVMYDGQIVGDGTFYELLNNNTYFKELYEEQYFSIKNLDVN
ncbi:MAG: hypothetical protein A2Y40_06620 [Candidatus Margulisbacteria bacterium GWF2_35_9]|nr:MAG: hypothetical protein A2Y40_06620 [Candidatus Margulisbacteria bacterium GWF2_35_9]